ncbi:hypothetical protein BH23CHL2_BH23CHL2_22820 [soil metagenome]
MTIVVPLSEHEPWRSILDASIELASLLPGRLEIRLADSHPAFERQVRDYVGATTVSRRATASVPISVTGRDIPDAHHKPDSVLVLSSITQSDETHSAVLDHLAQWDGPVFLVPGGPEHSHRSYADRVIVVAPETSNFDSIEPWATLIAASAHTHIVLLTAIAPESARNGSDLGKRVTAAHQRLGEKADQLRKGGTRTTWEVRVGDPAIEVARLAETTGTSLILTPKPAGDGPEKRLVARLIDQSDLHILLTT